MEIWKPTAHPKYQASSLGRVRRVTILKGYLKKTGYISVGCLVGNRNITKGAHQLIAEAFLGVCPKGKVVNHKNGKKTDNRPENLEYVTRHENSTHAAKTGLYRVAFKHQNTKTTLKIERKIAKLYDTGKFSMRELAIKFKLSKASISRICWRRR